MKSNPVKCTLYYSPRTKDASYCEHQTVCANNKRILLEKWDQAILLNEKDILELKKTMSLLDGNIKL